MTTATIPQHLNALALGNEIRIANAGTRREIHALTLAEGRALAAAILRDPEGHEDKIRLDRLLRAVRCFRWTRIHRCLDNAGMARGRLHRQLYELTERERHDLAAQVAR